MVVSVEERVVHHLPPVGLGASLQQCVDCRVSLTIERGEEEDKTAQNDATEHQFDIGILPQLGKEPLTCRHGAHEVKAHQSAEDAKEDA